MNIKLIRLENNTTNHSLVQMLLENAPTYSLNVSGEKVDKNAGKETFETIPDNFDHLNKHVIGVYHYNNLVGVIDLLIGYPNIKTTYIGLMLISEQNQSQGVGRATYDELEKYIRKKAILNTIRLSVVEANGFVVKFWTKMGFKLTGEKKPYQNKNIDSTSLLMEKNISEVQ